LPVDNEEDARIVVARLPDPRRGDVVVVVCRGETAVDVAALRTTLIGLADVVELRPMMSYEMTTVLKAARAWPAPRRAGLFPPRTAMARPGTQDRRQV
jgi:hypothetical protein